MSMVVVVIFLVQVVISFFQSSSNNKCSDPPPQPWPYRLETTHCTKLWTISPRFQPCPRVFLIHFTRLWLKEAYHNVAVVVVVVVIVVLFVVQILNISDYM